MLCASKKLFSSSLAALTRVHLRHLPTPHPDCGKPVPWNLTAGVRQKGETCYAFNRRWLAFSAELSPMGTWVGSAADRRQRLPSVKKDLRQSARRDERLLLSGGAGAGGF